MTDVLIRVAASTLRRRNRAAANGVFAVLAALAAGVLPGSASLPAAPRQDAAATAPFPYVPAKAYYVLPETHNNQSGYFSLSEGLDGNVHIGTAAYGENSYLVEFDPRTETQRVVLDTNKVCGLTARGYAAQAKIHTRNFVAPSGIVYVGSKQGYRLDENDTAEYPGGYVMSYDPRTGETRNLGMPHSGQGVADVTVDEGRGLIYVVTCEEQHWKVGNLPGGTPYHELGPPLTPYAMTLLSADGRAHAITSDFQLASYDPVTDKTEVRPIEVGGQRWTRANDLSIPTWVLTADRQHAWLILLNDATLLEIDLSAGPAVVSAVAHGKMIEGKNPDCRCGLDLAPDGNVYALIRIDNETGFGDGYLHHLTRYRPDHKQFEDLGVLKVTNPDYFDWERRDAEGNLQKWIHGFHRLPDGSLTPLHAHMSLKAAADNTLYATIIYPFTLLRIDAFRLPPAPSPEQQYLEWAEQFALDTASRIEPFTQVGQQIAQRMLDGGLIGFPFLQQPLAQELFGRSGGLVHIGFERPWKADRSEAERQKDVALVGYEGDPGTDDAAQLRELKARGVFLVGFGPSSRPALAEIVALCDAWFDTRLPEDDRVVVRPDGSRAGRGNLVANALHGVTLIAEVVGALTRQGRMPTMWKSYSYDDGRAWGEKYFQKIPFHDDYQVSPLGPGELGRRFLTQIRFPIRRLQGQVAALQQAAATLADEIARGSPVYVAWQGHMPLGYVGRGDDAAWARAVEFHPFLESQVAAFRSSVPDGGLVLSLGYHGLDPIQAAVWKEKQCRVIHLAGDHFDRDWRPAGQVAQSIDLGFAFGDACVSIDGYPIRLFAPSGLAQLLAYQAIQVAMPR